MQAADPYHLRFYAPLLAGLRRYFALPSATMLAPLQHFLALRPPLHHLLLRITRFVDTLDRWHPQLLETVEWTA